MLFLFQYSSIQQALNQVCITLGLLLCTLLPLSLSLDPSLFFKVQHIFQLLYADFHQNLNVEEPKAFILEYNWQSDFLEKLLSLLSFLFLPFCF
jgi:hypothetical protein